MKAIKAVSKGHTTDLLLPDVLPEKVWKLCLKRVVVRTTSSLRYSQILYRVSPSCQGKHHQHPAYRVYDLPKGARIALATLNCPCPAYDLHTPESSCDTECRDPTVPQGTIDVIIWTCCHSTSCHSYINTMYRSVHTFWVPHRPG